MADVGIFKKPFDALPLGIGDEHLTEMVVTHKPDEFHHPLVVELVENVIEQQDGLVADFLVVLLEW